MSRSAFVDRSGVPRGLSPQRAARWCLLASLRTLRLSIHRGRPISLPNLLHLYQRRLAEVAPKGRGGAGRDWLAALYRREQPFTGPSAR